MDILDDMTELERRTNRLGPYLRHQAHILRDQALSLVWGYYLGKDITAPPNEGWAFSMAYWDHALKSLEEGDILVNLPDAFLLWKANGEIKRD